MIKLQWLISAFLFLVSFTSLYAQIGVPAGESQEQLFRRRIVWRGGEYALRFSLEVERLQGGNYQIYLQEYTTSLYAEVSLPEGDFRFRVIPYDILGRPAEASLWFPFVVRISLSAGADEIEIIGMDDHVLAQGRSRNDETGRAAFFNTLGFSVGSSFSEPLVIVSMYGTFSPIQNVFIGLGYDIGFLSTYTDVESYYSFYPFAHLGVFMPFNAGGGFFAGIGGGYVIGHYVFPFGTSNKNSFMFDFSVGVNLINAITISYSIRTNFNLTNSKFAIGYVWRFR